MGFGNRPTAGSYGRGASGADSPVAETGSAPFLAIICQDAG